MRVRVLVEETVSRGGVVLAVSLDISNAFNTLPWSCILEALKYHRVPLYLRRTVETYLEGRCVIYRGRDGAGRHLMSCGVPQGSVLGPLLWNIGYDWVLRGELPLGADLTCYADDTLITAGSDVDNHGCGVTGGEPHPLPRTGGGLKQVGGYGVSWPPTCAGAGITHRGQRGPESYRIHHEICKKGESTRVIISMARGRAGTRLEPGAARDRAAPREAPSDPGGGMAA